MVIELTPIVALDGLNGEAELGGHLGEEVGERGQRLGLGTQGNSPRIVIEIIQHHQIIFITRNGEYR